MTTDKKIFALIILLIATVVISVFSTQLILVLIILVLKQTRNTSLYLKKTTETRN